MKIYMFLGELGEEGCELGVHCVAHGLVAQGLARGLRHHEPDPDKSLKDVLQVVLVKSIYVYFKERPISDLFYIRFSVGYQIRVSSRPNFLYNLLIK